MELQELKAKAYDLLAAKEQINQQLIQVNQEIVEKLQEEKPKEKK